MATHFNVLLVLKQRRFHDVAELQLVVLDIDRVLCDIRYSVPMALLHRFVGHELEQWAAFVEVIDLFLEIFVSLPVLKALWQTSASGIFVQAFVSDYNHWPKYN